VNVSAEHSLHLVAPPTARDRPSEASFRSSTAGTREGPRATLGEAPLFDGEGYVASAVATAPTRVLFVPETEVIALFRRYPAVARSLLATLARRVRRFAELAGSLTFRPVARAPRALHRHGRG
jgi:CRP-like cAMP-binding protein